MNYPPPFGQPPQSQQQYPRPGMPPQYGFAPPQGMPYPPFQQNAMPPARPFQSPSVFPRPPVVGGTQGVYQSQQIYHSAPVMKPPPPSQPEIAPTTVYVGNITDRYADYTIAEILSACGAMLAWKRVKGADFQLQAFGFCEYERPEAALRAVRLLNDLPLTNDRKLVVKVDPKTRERLVEWQKAKLIQSGKRLEDVDFSNLVNCLDEKTRTEDRQAKEKIDQIISAANVNTDDTDRDKPSMATELPKKTLHGLEIEEERRHLISKEIRHFRATDEGSKPSGKNKESTLAAAAVSPTSGDATDSSRTAARSPSRQREEVPVSTTATSTAPAVPGAPAEPIVDEEEMAERRRAERRAREKAERYAERLKSWEAREREKGRQYSRIREKEAETKRKQESEARKLKEFLEDYDDVRDDPKYYRGSALSQRLKEREREIESDSRDRKREREEMEDVRKKLRDQGCRNLEEEMEKLERATTEHLLPRLRGEENSPNHGAQIKTSTSPHSESTPSLEQHIQLLSSKLNRPDADDVGDEKSMDGTNSRQFVPARFETVEASSSSPQQSSNRKRQESSTIDEERAESGGDAATLSLKLSINKAKRLAAAISVVAAADIGSSTGMGRLGPMIPDNETLTGPGLYMSEESKKERIQQLIQSIPSAKEELFAYAIDWGVVDKLLMEKRVRPWIDKKIVEYIGEKEPTLSEFLCQKVLARTAPEKILEDIGVIFDEDAPLFVVKLWRLLVYETEARKQGLVKI